MKNTEIVQKNFPSKRIFIILSIILLVVAILFVLKNNISPPQKQTTQQKIKELKQKNINIYKNDYWGFSVKYPKEWYMYDAPSGQNYYFQSYKKDPNSNHKNIPNENQLKINVKVSVSDDSIVWQNIEGFLHGQNGPMIGGQPSLEIYVRSNERQNDNVYIVYQIKHNDYMYLITAEPADSKLLPYLKQFLSDFSFIAGREYQTDLNKPSNDTLIYQDQKLGFLFSYSKNMYCKKNDIAVCVLMKQGDDSPIAPSIMVELADNIYNNDKTFEENILHYAAIICEAGGPGGTISCPKDGMRIEVFKNKNGVKGYKVHRKMIRERVAGNTIEIVETKDDLVIFYPLDAPHYFAVAFRADASDLQQELLDIADAFNYLQIKNK